MSKQITSAQTIDWKELLTLFSPAGQQQMVDFIRQAQADRGRNWLPEIQTEYPMFSWIVELVCTKSADDAFAELQAAYPTYPLSWVKPKLLVYMAP